MSLGLTVIVPAYNEAASLKGAVESLVAGISAIGIPFEVVIVNDGSRDRTGEIAESLVRSLVGTRVVHHGMNQGFGGAVRTGIANAKHELIVFCPVDSPLTGPEAERFLAAIECADIVIGYREERPGYNFWMRAGSKCYHRLVCWLFDLKLRDVNWIHIYRRAAVGSLSLSQSGIVFLAEVLAKAHRRGYRISEICSKMRPRLSGRATVTRPRVLLRSLRDLFQLWREMQRPELGPTLAIKDSDA